MITKKFIGILAVLLVAAVALVGAGAAGYPGSGTGNSISDTYYIADGGTGSGNGTMQNPASAETFITKVDAGGIVLTSYDKVIIPEGKTVTLKDTKSSGAFDASRYLNAKWENNGTVIITDDIDGSKLNLATASIGGSIRIAQNINGSGDNLNILKSCSIEGVNYDTKITLDSVKIGDSKNAGLTVTLKNVGFNAPVSVESKNNSVTFNNVDVTSLSGAAISIESGSAGAQLTFLGVSEITGENAAVSFADKCTLTVENGVLKITGASGSILKAAASTGNNSTITLSENAKVSGGKLYDADSLAAASDKNQIVVSGPIGMQAALGGENGAQQGTVVVNGDFSLYNDYTYGDVATSVPDYLQKRNLIINGKLNLNGHIFVVGNTTVNGTVSTATNGGFGGAMIPVKNTKLSIGANSTVSLDTNTTSSSLKSEIENVIGSGKYMPLNLFNYVVNALDSCKGYLVNATDIKDGNTVLISAGVKISTSGGSSSKTSTITLSGSGSYALSADIASGKNLKIVGTGGNCKVILSGSTTGIEGSLTILAPVEMEKDASVTIGKNGSLTIGSSSRFVQNGASITVNGGYLTFEGGNVTMDGNLTVTDGSFKVSGGNLTLIPSRSYVLDGSSTSRFVTLDVLNASYGKGKILGGATIQVSGNVSLYYDFSCNGKTVYINDGPSGGNTVCVKVGIQPDNSDLLHVQMYEIQNKKIVKNINVSDGMAYLDSGSSTSISYTPLYSFNILPVTNINGMYIEAGDKTYIMVVFNDDGTFQYFTNENGVKLKNGQTYSARDNLYVTAVASTYRSAATQEVSLLGATVDFGTAAEEKKSAEVPEKSQITILGASSVTAGKETLFMAMSSNGRATSFTWSVSDPTIASIDKKGTLKALKAGTVTVTVQDENGLSASKIITVKQAAKKTTTTTSSSENKWLKLEEYLQSLMKEA